MKFLLDVNASGIFTLLLELNYDIACVNSVDAKMSDDEILNWAVSEDRIIITTDSDFEQMIWLQDRIHCGVLRLENLPRLERMALIQEVLTNYAVDLASGSVIIATQQKIRIRRKPKLIENRNKKQPNN
jgi:predicted nuclease of predicted toxin-antitoxin system